ncbi:MAG: 16S rRNA (guanine(527)-N(7))-methyltransferase RsmG [Lachnospiraceae bacterium]|nr:16S rRNA (guanine(527)-N(7))-methyltransferase RsmG [Lachnospiraceae bacterium]
MKYNLDSFKKGCEALDLKLTDKQYENFIRYYEMLIEKNKVMNLTAITDFDEVFNKHFLDSLAINKVYDISKVQSLIDIGSGAGFPGLPIKIAFPHIRVVLLDSLNKRIDFLKTVIDELGLTNIECVHGRAEDFARDESFREKFDLSLSRAVANLRVLLEYDVPFVKVGGNFVSYKAADVQAEIEESKNAMNEMGVSLIEKELLIPGTELKRKFLIFNKTKNTNEKYPRKAGVPQKKPL